MGLRDNLNLLARAIHTSGQPAGPTLQWATVVAGAGGVHVVLDEDVDAKPRPVTDNAAGPVSINDRVQVAHHGTRLTLLSRPVSDTGWQPLTLLEGFTGGAWYRLRDGEVRLYGRVIRAAGNWPVSFSEACVALPVALLPTLPASATTIWIASACDASGEPLVVTADAAGLKVAAGTAGSATAWVELSSIPPWRVD